MTILREERDAAFDKVSNELIDVLIGWLTREKRNLEGFIANPEGHVEYNPFAIFDFDSLNQRVAQLGQIISGLQVIYAHKAGFTDVATRAMHDYAVDHIPNIIWNRLYEWAWKRANDMKIFLEQKANEPPIPIQDYRSAITFDVAKYMLEIKMYDDTAEGLRVTLDFATQEGLSI